MKKKRLQPMYLVGRDFTLKELRLIKEIVKLYPGLSRTELSKTICENISWQAPTGTNKYNSCLKALEKLEGEGYIKLPLRRLPKARKRTPITITERSDPEGLIEARIDQWGKITINRIEREQVGLWNEYVYRYHYLGYKSSFGLHQKYFIKSGDRILGCILYSCAAWSLECRDRWIGWTCKERKKNLSRIINMNRFLIFPWVRIK
ncbi:MAG: Druantia anti-phage system protein DruA, partial [bacterium]